MNPAKLLAHFDRISDAPDAILRLRRFILDLAVRGNLVEQDPRDESASKSLKVIQAEKERRVAVGQIRKIETLPPIEPDEVPFVAPAHWELVRLGEALELVNGRAFKPNEWSKKGLPIIRIQNLNNTEASFNYCDATIPDKFHVKTGDFLISWSGTPGTSFGAHIWDRGKAVLNQHIFRAELIGKAFLPHFLKLAINSRLLELIDQAHGGVGLQHITKPKLEMLPLTLPPIAEQQRIVAKVDELMALCGRLEAAQAERESRRDQLVASSLGRLNNGADPDTFRNHARFYFNHLPRLTTKPEHIQQLRQTILNLAVRGKLVPQDPNDEPAADLLKRIQEEKGRQQKEGKIDSEKLPISPRVDELAFELKPGWQVAKISQILVELQTGPFGSSLHQSDYQKGGIPVINPASIKEERLMPVEGMAVGRETLKRLSTFKLRTGDIVMARRGEMGRCAVVTEQEDGWLCGTGSLILRLPTCVSPRFLVTLIGSPFVREYLGGSAVGATMQNLNQSILLNLVVGLPPLAEQQRIVAKVDELMALCDKLEAQLTTTHTESHRLLEAVLQEAFTATTREAV